MAWAPFDDHLARLSRREMTVFVGALLTARGWDVEVDPPVVRATKGDRRQVVAVAREGYLPGHGLPGHPVDTVVGIDAERTRALAATRDARAWDAQTLYDVARHGLDSAATDRLFREHLDATAETVGRPGVSGEERTDAAGRPPNRPRDGRQAPAGRGRSEAASATGATGRVERRLVPLLLVAVCVVAGTVAVQGLTGVPPVDTVQEDAMVDEPPGPETDSPTPVPTASPTPEPRQVVPGLTESGIVDTPALARAHAAVLDNRSFTMRITYAEQTDARTLGRAYEVIHVSNGTVYRSRGTSQGNLTSDLVPVIVRDLYADGDGRYLRQGDDALRVGDADDPGAGQFVERSRALVVWHLSGVRSSFVGRVQQSGTAYYRVVVEGTSDRRIGDYQATGLVTERGLVLAVNANYRLPQRDRTVTLSIRYTNVGESRA
jgi:hypothetical protein